MKAPYIIYYHFKKNYIWLVLNILALFMIVSCVSQMPALIIWWQVQTLFCLFGVTLFLWGYKYLLKHKVVEFSEQGIKIDHCRILHWEDVLGIEYRKVRCFGKDLPVVSVLTRKNMAYKYNFLQKRCQKIGFGAFSIPLYDIKKTDIEKIYNILNKYISAKN